MPSQLKKWAMLDCLYPYQPRLEHPYSVLLCDIFLFFSTLNINTRIRAFICQNNLKTICDLIFKCDNCSKEKKKINNNYIDGWAIKVKGLASLW